MNDHVLVIAGTRPELQKLATVVPALRAAGLPVTFFWTGQHYDASMTTGFAEGLGWPVPDAVLPSGPVGEHPVALAARISIRWTRTAGVRVPALVLVQGDTRSAQAGAVFADASRRSDGTLLCHLEAGLRSWEPDLPEETIRRAVDRDADLLLCPSAIAAAHAQVDAKPSARILVTGQTGLDAFVDAAEKAVPFASRDPWILLTLHRQALADDPDALADVLEGVEQAAMRIHAHRVVWPVHPRLAGLITTDPRYQPVKIALAGSRIERHEPMSYRSMVGRLTAPNRPLLVVSDSGGLVEESCFEGIPTIIVRPATERWELVARGDAVLVRPEHARKHLADAAAERIAHGPGSRSGKGRAASPYGNPLAARLQTPTARAVRAITDYLHGPRTR